MTFSRGAQNWLSSAQQSALKSYAELTLNGLNSGNISVYTNTNMCEITTKRGVMNLKVVRRSVWEGLEREKGGEKHN